MTSEASTNDILYNASLPKRVAWSILYTLCFVGFILKDQGYEVYGLPGLGSLGALIWRFWPRYNRPIKLPEMKPGEITWISILVGLAVVALIVWIAADCPDWFHTKATTKVAPAQTQPGILGIAHPWRALFMGVPWLGCMLMDWWLMPQKRRRDSMTSSQSPQAP
ncbi:MAG: hypothetical protein NTW19_02085 [Planctomycetota bacterium]|nr:hypothetical protein [Planctomycetota bacterium]